MNRKPVYFGANKRIISCPNGLWQAQKHSGREAHSANRQQAVAVCLSVRRQAKILALGVYPVVSLEETRRRREEAKKLLARSIDPSVQHKSNKQAGKDSSFRAVAQEVIAKLEREGRAKPTLDKTRWLLDFGLRRFGDRPVAEITARDLLALLREIEDRGRKAVA